MKEVIIFILGFGMSELLLTIGPGKKNIMYMKYNNLITQCESTIARDKHCEIVMSAKITEN